MNSQSSPKLNSEIKIKLLSMEISTLGSKNMLTGYLHDDPRWLKLVENYGNAPKVEIEVYSLGKCILEIRGNIFPASRFGKKVLVVGGYLDYGIYLKPDCTLDVNIDEILKLVGIHLGVKKIVTKQKVEIPNTNQTLAIIDLSNSTKDTYFSKMKSRARNDIRKALTNDVTIEFNQELVGEFYRLYTIKMYEFGTPPHPLKFFEDMINQFEDDMYVGLARIGDKVIAASVGINIGINTYHLFAISDSKFSSTGAGDLLLYEEINRSIESGIQKFWLGRSQKGSGVEFYKSKWGPEFFGTTESIWESKIGSSEINHSTSRDLVAMIFKALPYRIFKFIGTKVRKYIP